MLRVFTLTAVVLMLSAGSARAQVKLERKFVEGKKYVTHRESKTHQILMIGGQDVETKTSQFMITSVTTGTRKDDGTLPIVTKVDKLQGEMQFPGASVAFDSGDPDRKADNPQFEPLLTVFRATAKSQWTTFYDKNNAVKSVEYGEGLIDMVDERFKGQFDPERRKRAMVQELAILPDKPVSQGDTWTRTNDMNLGEGQTLLLETRYEYLGTTEKKGKTLDRIGIKVTGVTYSQEEKAAATGTRVTAGDLKVAESTGEILFDRTEGLVIDVANRMRIEGSLTLSINGMEIPAGLNLTFEGKTYLQP
jgi:Family of unknown function (DUF6263)